MYINWLTDIQIVVLQTYHSTGSWAEQVRGRNFRDELVSLHFTAMNLFFLLEWMNLCNFLLNTRQWNSNQRAGSVRRHVLQITAYRQHNAFIAYLSTGSTDILLSGAIRHSDVTRHLRYIRADERTMRPRLYTSSMLAALRGLLMSCNTLATWTSYRSSEWNKPTWLSKTGTRPPLNCSTNRWPQQAVDLSSAGMTSALPYYYYIFLEGRGIWRVYSSQLVSIVSPRAAAAAADDDVETSTHNLTQGTAFSSTIPHAKHLPRTAFLFLYHFIRIRHRH